MSTTEDPSFIAGYVNMQPKRQFMVFQIISRKGITLQDSLEQPGSLQSLEKERLLPANVNYRIVGVTEEIFSVDQTRNSFMTQISRSARPIKNKKLTVVKLIDEDEI